jgi:hypothetical protein
VSILLASLAGEWKRSCWLTLAAPRPRALAVAAVRLPLTMLGMTQASPRRVTTIEIDEELSSRLLDQLRGDAPADGQFRISLQPMARFLSGPQATAFRQV